MKEFITRVFSGCIYILLLLSATWYSKNTFFLLFGLFLILSTYEFCELIQLKKTIPMVIAVSGYIIFRAFNTTHKTIDLLLTAACLFVSIQLIVTLFRDQKLPSDLLSKYVYLSGYIILPIIILTKIPFIATTYHPEIIISIFFLIWTNDTFAYLVGKSIGKRKLLEKISPKKTIEGFLGGVFFTLLLSIFISFYLQQTIYIWILTAVIACVFGTIGDLIESKFKRNANVKDSGKIMPGHGGILDRLDSIIFVSPFLFLFHQILNYVS